MAERTFDVFISYAHKDRPEWVEVLATNLHQRGFEVFLDAWEIGAGDVLVHELDRGILESRHGVLVLTKSYFERPFVRAEYAAILHRTIEGKQRVIPVLVDDVEVPPLLASSDLGRLPRRRRPAYDEKLEELVRALQGKKAKDRPERTGETVRAAGDPLPARGGGAADAADRAGAGGPPGGRRGGGRSRAEACRRPRLEGADLGAGAGAPPEVPVRGGSGAPGSRRGGRGGGVAPRSLPRRRRRPHPDLPGGRRGRGAAKGGQPGGDLRLLAGPGPGDPGPKPPQPPLGDPPPPRAGRARPASPSPSTPGSTSTAPPPATAPPPPSPSPAPCASSSPSAAPRPEAASCWTTRRSSAASWTPSSRPEETARPTSGSSTGAPSKRSTKP